MSWIQTAKVGDRVVCVEKIKAKNRESTPVVGSTYTIRGIICDDDGVFFWLAEIINPVLPYSDGTFECVFDALAFRPVQSRPTDISVFERLLNTVPSEMEGV